MDSRKLVLRYLVIIQVYQGSHFVNSSQDPDAALIPDKVCLPFDKAELDSYLKKFDTPEASISNTVSSLSVKDIESLPFGALSVDWRRLRLLSDLSTGIDRISTYNDFTGFSAEAFSTTGNTRVPDDKRETTTHVRLNRSTLNNRNGNIDYSAMTVEPDTFDGSREEIRSVTESETETPIDVEENFGLTGIPMLEEVEMMTTDSNITTTTDSGITDISTDSDTETTKRTVILRIGELFSSVPKFVEHHEKNHVSRVRNFIQNREGDQEDALAKTRLSVFEPFELGQKLKNRKPKSRYESDVGLVKRGGHNTDTEKLFRWFYRSDQNPQNSGNSKAEIKCTERS